MTALFKAVLFLLLRISTENLGNFLMVIGEYEAETCTFPEV